MSSGTHVSLAHSDLADIALESVCALLKEATHFNFRVNLMSCIVARLSKKSWDSVCAFFICWILCSHRSIIQSSELCLNTLIHVFREDLTGVVSLEIVRLLNRMIKEKRFNVRPEVLSCLLYLRLKTELGIRASDSSVDKPLKKESGSKAAARRAKGKTTELPHLSKKAKKALKEKREIDKEYREAEAEVNKEERMTTVSISVLLKMLGFLERSHISFLSLSKQKLSSFSLSSIFEFSRIQNRRRSCQQPCMASRNSLTL